MKLEEQIKLYPNSPGVYLMKDSDGVIIYIGKAKNLKIRLKNYFLGQDDRYQVQFLMKKVSSIETIITTDEQQALILERDLINRHKPKYNIRLKDDKAYLSIKINTNAKWPKIELVRKTTESGVLYFGPYPSSFEVRTLVELINKVIPLRTCSDTVFLNRQRPCLEYQLKRCCAPCCLAVDPEQYREYLKQAINILEGRSDLLEQYLEKSMNQAAEQLRFEDAAVLRDRLEQLVQFQSGQKFIFSDLDEQDVFVIHHDQTLASLAVLNVKNTRIVANTNYEFSNVGGSTAEILESAIIQYYQNHSIPREVLIACELNNKELEKYLSELRGSKCNIECPKIGYKARLLELARMNARQHYLLSFESDQRWNDVQVSLAKKFKLNQMPRRVECVDISNLQGSDIVGAIVTFFDGSPRKDLYKKFIIKQSKQDDFAAIYEVVYRRLAKGKINDDLPDLLVIDGGSAQLNKALAAANDLNLEIDIIALAKERSKTAKAERIFLAGAEQAVILNPSEDSTHFLVKIRDETHRFVLSFHRKKRFQRLIKSKLDDIPGIGIIRKMKLLKHFGSINKIIKASDLEIAKVAKISPELAKKIKVALT